MKRLSEGSHPTPRVKQVMDKQEETGHIMGKVKKKKKSRREPRTCLLYFIMESMGRNPSPHKSQTKLFNTEL